MKKPRLLDLFCGAGGATKGYQRAGFYVVGVDIKPQPHYCGDEFYQADALEFPLEGYDAYHASPPCQHASRASQPWKAKGKLYIELITPTREIFSLTNKPYIIENVVGSKLINPLALNGAMFNLKVIRRRHFETNFPFPLVLMVRPSGKVSTGELVCPFGWGGDAQHGGDWGRWGDAMGIDWMANKQELNQAIPPAYTEYIGKYLMEYLMELLPV